MRSYTAEVIIMNKKAAGDPQGETIYHQIQQKAGAKQVASVRSGKLLRMEVEAENKRVAEKYLREMSKKLRIYNPVAHELIVNVKRSEKKEGQAEK